MERELKSNYATVDISKSMVQLYEELPFTPSWSYFTIKNVTIKFKADTTIEIIAEKIQIGFTFKKVFVEDLTFTKNPIDAATKLGYRTISDWFYGIKKPYLNWGWYVLDKTISYHCILSKWFVVL